MPAEAKCEHPQSVLLVGEASPTVDAPLDPARDQGWRFVRQGDVYAAAVYLLRTAQPPAAVFVRVDSLRADEMRFFDLLARRWPALNVAATAGTPDDRRLALCRQRGVSVIPAEGLADWLGRSAPAVAQEPAAPAAEPEPPQVEAESPIPPVAAEPTAPPAPESQPGQSGLSIHEMPEDSFVDLPDELVEQMPDDLSEDDEPAAGPGDERDSKDAFEDDLPEIAEADQSEPDEAELPDTGSENLDHVPLTPWSSVPRPHRQPPARRAPRAEPVPAADDPADRDPSVQPNGARPAEPPSHPPRRDSAGDARELGLLTPEELRALLQDPLDDGSQEARP